jgi:ATP-dependent Clp protease ATP-binding subunit ClpA
MARRLAGLREARAALVIDFGTRIARSPDQCDQPEHRFYVSFEKLSLTASPVTLKGDGHGPLFNPVIWLLNRAQDAPSWFVLDSERIATHTIGRPDYEMRAGAAGLLAPLFLGYEEAAEPERAKFCTSFADATDGMTLCSMSDITQLAAHQRIALRDIDDAVRCYKVGALDNPWKKDYLREKIVNAREVIEERVKGQHQAVTKTIDILMRSVMGLTGAQARSGGSRPRGVLFFAGPTGVGKTELAKTLTSLIFGDERAYIRFDMSEFSEEHTGARLLGAPPGYVGYDAGGELTNAVREKPFSVVLFDEIEKGHARILDKFLQILEDGRLTDGRGETTYFSETIIIFTSNLGIYVEDETGRRIQNVKPDDPYDTVEARIREAIGNYFKYRLSRPEILNRIGDNIVVFNFITPDVAALIFKGMLKNVVNRMREEHKVALEMPDAVREKLLALCTRDLSNGGRGIGNQLESTFINPLSRALFSFALQGRKSVTVADVVEEDRIFSVRLA